MASALAELERIKETCMKRDIISLKGRAVSGCCPGHDTWPNESYENRRSKRARSRDKKREHRYVRRITKRIKEN